MRLRWLKTWLKGNAPLLDAIPKVIPAFVWVQTGKGGILPRSSQARKLAAMGGLTVFLPEYDRYGKAAPIVRNKAIVDYSDKVIVFWDGSSKGTLSVIKYAEKIGKPCDIILCRPSDL